MPELIHPLPNSPPTPPFTHLILVCCHATYLGPTTHPSSTLDESNWSLQSFQRSNPTTSKPSELHTFLSHIHTAAALTASTPSSSSLLIFSGGQTTPTQPSNPTSLTEAQSYASLLKLHLSTLPPNTSQEISYACENSATDSHQNLLFSLLLFHHLVHSYPQHITVITHAFKLPRFLRLHGPAIKFPAHRLRVLGISPPFTVEEAEETEKGERERGLGVWERDAYGIGEVLGRKRRERGWREERVREGWMGGLEGRVRELVEWRGGRDGREVFPGRLLWEVE